MKARKVIFFEDDDVIEKEGKEIFLATGENPINNNNMVAHFLYDDQTKPNVLSIINRKSMTDIFGPPHMTTPFIEGTIRTWHFFFKGTLFNMNVWREGAQIAADSWDDDNREFGKLAIEFIEWLVGEVSGERKTRKRSAS